MLGLWLNGYMRKKLVPDCFKTPQQVMLGIQVGISFGFTLFGQISKALSNMMPINNVIKIWGDLPLSIVRERGNLTHF